MANRIYTIQYKGQEFDIEGPDGATPDQLLRAAQQHSAAQPVDPQAEVTQKLKEAMGGMKSAQQLGQAGFQKAQQQDSFIPGVSQYRNPASGGMAGGSLFSGGTPTTPQQAPSPQFVAGMSSIPTMGAGPVANTLGAMLSGLPANEQNAGGITGANVGATAASMLPGMAGKAAKALEIAKNALPGVGAVAGQAVAGNPMSPGASAATVGASAILPPLLQGLVQKIATNPIAQSLFTKSQGAKAGLMEALGLAEPQAATLPARIGDKAAQVEADVAPQTAQLKIDAAKAKAGVKEAKAALQDATPGYQQKMADFVTDRSNAIDEMASKSLFRPRDTKGLFGDVMKSNPALAEKLFNVPEKELPKAVDEAVKFYNEDMASNIMRRLEKGNTNVLQEHSPVDPEIAQKVQAIKDGVDENIPQYKKDIAELLPRNINNWDQLQTLAQTKAARPNFQAVVPNKTQEMIKGYWKRYTTSIPPSFVPPEQEAALQTAQRTLDEVGSKLDIAKATEKPAWEAAGLTAGQVKDLKGVAKQAPESLFTDLARSDTTETRAKIMQRASAIRTIFQGEDVPNEVLAGTLGTMLKGNDKGVIENAAQTFKKAEPVLRRLTGDEGKVDKIRSFFNDLQDAQDRVTKSDNSGRRIGLFLGADAAGLGIAMYHHANPALYAAGAAAGAAGTAILKWPSIVETALEKNGLGAKLLHTVANADTTQAANAAFKAFVVYVGDKQPEKK